MTRWRLLTRSLRFRLAVWNALVLVSIACALLFGVRQGVHWALLHELDQLLQEDMQEVVLAVQDTSEETFPNLAEELTRKALGHRHHGWFVELRGADDKLIWASEHEMSRADSGPENGGETNPAERRMVDRRLTRGATGIEAIRIGATLDLFHRDMAVLDRLMGIALVSALVLAPCCGYWLAGRAARTMGEIIQTAARLRPSHLEERLPLRGTGDELDQLAFTVNGLLDRIAEYLQHRRDFLANAAHELRTPLAAIRSSIEVALNSPQPIEEHEQLLGDVIAQAEELETLVNQLLLLSDTEDDQWRHHQQLTPLKDVAGRAVEMFRGVAELRDIELMFRAAGDAPVLGSRKHLRQVINNLVDNAVKYTTTGGRVTVSVAADTSMRQAVLSVEDTGVGISPTDLTRVFERFFRGDKAHARDDATRGTGLGLSICEAVITAHGGAIQCTSQLGVGTRMEVRLPLAATTPHSERPEACAAPPT